MLYITIPCKALSLPNRIVRTSSALEPHTGGYFYNDSNTIMIYIENEKNSAFSGERSVDDKRILHRGIYSQVACTELAKPVHVVESIGQSDSAELDVGSVEVGQEEAAVDVVINVKYGSKIQLVCAEVQQEVKKAIEMMTGLRVVEVNVCVQSVTFENDKDEKKKPEEPRVK